MFAEKYLEKLENENEKFVIDAPIREPPPERSSFYWNNCGGNKYKVFIPTKDRQFYYNLEEYNMDELINLETTDEKWRKANKCVQLAVSESKLSDKVVVDAMDNLIKMFGKQNRKGWKYEETTEDLKYYILFKYSVEDIQHSEMKTRHEKALFYQTITLSPHEDSKRIMLIDYAFRKAAKRFQTDECRKVHSYRKYHYYNYL